MQRWTIPDWMIPKGEVGSPTNPGPFSEVPAKLPKGLRFDPFTGPPPPTPPAQADPVTAAVKQGIASRVPTRMPKARPLAVPQPDPFAGATPSNAPTGSAELPQVSGPQQPLTLGLKPTGPSRIINPSAPEPSMTGSEGRAATWTNERVMELAGKGNREAIQQAVRRGMELPPGARYVMGDPDFSRTIYNPRESTTFTPEGEPIRNLETPEKSSRARIALPEEGATPKEIINASTGEVTQPQVPLAEVPAQKPSRPLAVPGYKLGEKAETLAQPRKSLGPEFESQQREEMIQRYRGILRNPKATPEDVAEATARMRELSALQGN
jgi:hypothetical protein